MLELRDARGGCANIYRQDAFTFDGGPTITAAPQVLDAIFAKAGRRREDYLQLVRCDPYDRILDGTGRRFDYNGDEAFVLSEIDEDVSNADVVITHGNLIDPRSVAVHGTVRRARPLLD